MKVKWTLMTILIIILLGAVSCGDSPYAYAEGPKIKIVTENKDLGEVEKGKIIEFNIEVKNEGTAELIIEKVNSGCSCLTAPFTGEVSVLPKESMYLAARLNTDKVSGNFERMVRIVSNDPLNNIVQWSVKGHIIGEPFEIMAPEVPAAKAREAISSTIAVTVFYSPECMECVELINKLLPQLEERYKSSISIVKYNMKNTENFEKLLALQEKYDKRPKSSFFNPKPPIVFVGEKLFYGEKEIKEGIREMGLWLD